MTQMIVPSQAGAGAGNPNERVIDQAINQIFRSSSKVLLNCKEAGPFNPYLEGARNVIRNMHDLWTKRQLCDVTLECKDEVLYAHKLVMAAYSDTLCGRFAEYPLSQAITISLREFTASTVQTMLEFMYTTELTLSVNNVGELLTLSTELGVSHVRNSCLNYLAAITLENCFTFLDIALKSNLKDLLERVEQFMIDNFSEIIQSDSFKTLSPDRLVRFLTEHTRKGNFKELELFKAIVSWIEHDRDERVSMAPDLLRSIKLHHISARDLVNHVEKVDFITGTPECFHMLYSAMTYHALENATNNAVFK